MTSELEDRLAELRTSCYKKLSILLNPHVHRRHNKVPVPRACSCR